MNINYNLVTVLEFGNSTRSPKGGQRRSEQSDRLSDDSCGGDLRG